MRLLVVTSCLLSARMSFQEGLFLDVSIALSWLNVIPESRVALELLSARSLSKSSLDAFVCCFCFFTPACLYKALNSHHSTQHLYLLGGLPLTLDLCTISPPQCPNSASIVRPQSPPPCKETPGAVCLPINSPRLRSILWARFSVLPTTDPRLVRHVL